jgi:hypothetical protein
MPQRLETPRDPLTIGRGLDHNARRGSAAEYGREAFGPLHPISALLVVPRAGAQDRVAITQDAGMSEPVVDTSCDGKAMLVGEKLTLGRPAAPKSDAMLAKRTSARSTTNSRKGRLINNEALTFDFNRQAS